MGRREGGKEGGKEGGREARRERKREGGGTGEKQRGKEYPFHIMYTTVMGHLLPQACLPHSHPIEIHHANTTVAISIVLKEGKRV